MRWGRGSVVAVAAVLGLALVGTAPVRATSTAGRAASPTTVAPDPLELLPIQTSPDRRFVDSAGRDVLLRGANLNSLGEYWQGVPGLDPTIPVTNADWDSMAAHGFSVVRLLVTWSRVEPSRGTIDQTYLDQVEAAVDAAAARGIYTVIDMHQDAYTAFLATADPADCAAGTTPAKGWDGAPAWAVLDDGLSTCLTNGERNSSPAVNRAWNNFYDNVDGIRDRFAASWGAIASRFAGRAEVAGYDILNEPENPRAAADLQAVYEEFLADVIGAIRAAEAGASFDHVIFIEPALPAADPSRGLVIPDPTSAGVGTENIAASVHNYAESIGDPLGAGIEGTNQIVDDLTAGLGVPNWGGEYGFWDTSPETLAKARRYAADEDRLAWGGAWWQWRQSCGDPHAVRWEGGAVVAPTGVETHLNLLQCPGNVDLGPNEDFLRILGRGYPRATPGRILELRSDIDTGLLKVKATVAEGGGQLVVWSPTEDGVDHPINVFGLTDVASTEVEGGRIITATVSEAGVYALWIGEPDEELAEPERPTAEPPGAQPVSAAPSYTG